MPNMQGETVRLKSTTNKGEQNDDCKKNRHKMCAQSKVTQGINSGQNILPAIQFQHVQQISYAGVTKYHNNLLQIIKPNFNKFNAFGNNVGDNGGMHGPCMKARPVHQEQSHHSNGAHHMQQANHHLQANNKGIESMHASGCKTTKQMRFHAGMPNLQSETIEIESSTNKDDQNGG